MQRFLPLLLATMLCSVSAIAQPTYRVGVRGGFNHATTTLDAAIKSQQDYPYSYSAEKSAIYAWQAGAVLEIAFGKFAVQPGLLFSQKGERFVTSMSSSGVAGMSGSDTHSTDRYNWLELPVNLVYSVRGVQLFGGPYAALGLGGRQRGKTLSYSPVAKFAPYYFNEKIRYGYDTYNSRLDAGVNVGVGYCQGHLQVQLGYQLGFLNLHRSNDGGVITRFPTHGVAADAPAYNRMVQLTGTYFFDL
jgi:hypothetical protein